MRKNGFTIIEVVIVFLIILGVTFFVLPSSMNDTKQAGMIARWAEDYSQVEYIFSVIKAKNEDALFQKLSKTKDNNLKAEIIIEMIKPYLRIKSGVENSKYKQFYMDKRPVLSGDKYYIDNFYFTESNQIVGLKWFAKDCTRESACGFMTFDVNGIDVPNTWGKDIFGLDIYENRVEPFGKNEDVDTLRRSCSYGGSGLLCSYYYLIGGKFD